MTEELKLHFKFDEIKEDKVIDSSGHQENEGIVHGTPQVILDPKLGSCLNLDESDSIEVPDNDNLRIQNYTVEIWIKPELTHLECPGWIGVVGKPGRNYNIWLESNNAFIRHCFHEQRGPRHYSPDTPPNSIKNGQWNHVAITNDRQQAKTYINGKLEATGDVQDPIIDNTILIIGRNLDGNPGCFFKGQLAQLRVYNYALSPEEIEHDINTDKKKFFPKQVLGVIRETFYPYRTTCCVRMINYIT